MTVARLQLRRLSFPLGLGWSFRSLVPDLRFRRFAAGLDGADHIGGDTSCHTETEHVRKSMRIYIHIYITHLYSYTEACNLYANMCINNKKYRDNTHMHIHICAYNTYIRLGKRYMYI